TLTAPSTKAASALRAAARYDASVRGSTPISAATSDRLTASHTINGVHASTAGLQEPGASHRWNLATTPRWISWALTSSFDVLRTLTRMGWSSSDGRAQGTGSLKPA
ncbi:hypothetical protein THAOC_23433, partial [Thalassiosira oceanica]